ncbi:hypothetical protein Glove_328g31 [Diversispora epigaea]|uniref:Uncharacterized protein n=1 Tax=Diversispora epigaea TaxID=1348612 RepID=A0A397HQ27_9GLOM|nr:hypothetical protein Glove_328g31 [Diversispora epigaea]
MNFCDDTREIALSILKEIAGVISGAMLATASGPFAPLIGTLIYLGGKAVKKILGKQTLGNFIEDVGIGTFFGGLFTIMKFGRLVAQIAKNGRKIFRFATVALISAGKAILDDKMKYDERRKIMMNIEEREEEDYGGEYGSEREDEYNRLTISI